MTPSSMKYSVNMDRAIEHAKNCNFSVIETDKNTVLIDLDEPKESYDHYIDMLSILESNNISFRQTEFYVSKSGRGYHAVLKFEKDLSPLERLLLQACLGSDRKRELLGLILRYWNGLGDRSAGVLFKPPEDEMRTVSCRTCKKSFSFYVSELAWNDWKNGALIQHAMPDITSDQRELLISQTCGECWDKLFKDEE